MPARKPDYAMKCKIWFPQYTTEANGSIEHCVVQAFGGLPADKRAALLNRLAEIHAAASLREIEKQTAAGSRSRNKDRTMKQHLRYCLRTAFDQKETRHAQAVMKALGIAYEKAVPQSMGDQWWFLNCDVEDVAKLPPYLEPMDLRPEQVAYWTSAGKEGKP